MVKIMCGPLVAHSELNVLILCEINSACNTPNGERATCMSIRDCQVLFRTLMSQSKSQQQTEFLRDSHCGNMGRIPLVCCGTVDNYGSFRSLPIPTTEATLNWNVLPSRNVCGRQTSASRILGGEKTALEEFPWMALLEYRRRGVSVGFYCGGVLISSRYVLTASHCIVGQIKQVIGEVYQVRLGEYDTSQPTDCSLDIGCSDPPINILVEERIYHTGYDDNSLDHYHDIGLLRLSREAPFTTFIRPICLPTNNSTDFSVLGDKLYVAGWGQMENNSHSTVKLKLAVPIVEQSYCKSVFRTAGSTIGSKQICAGGEANKDSCKGDSGGPLMNTVRGNSNVWYVEGIVSFGFKCGTQGKPGIYTKVSEYMTWILSNIKN